MYRNSNIIAIFILILTFCIAALIHLWSSSYYVQKAVTIDLDVAKFNNYLVQFNKSYSGNEYKRRLQNFKVSLAEIARLNTLENATVFGLTQFSDMSAEEFANQMLMRGTYAGCQAIEESCSDDFNDRLTNKTILTAKGRYWDNWTVPEKMDWREKGYVSPVQDQRQCNACWAFALIGVMETIGADQTNFTRQPLSVQEVLDCASYQMQCEGGKVSSAMKRICSNKTGIVTENEYPLTLKNYSPCAYVAGPALTIKNYTNHCNMNEDDLVRLIAFHGPVTTILTFAPLFNYIGGIIHRACVKNEKSALHAVQIVGYDKTGPIPYYILKNSWGTFFGEHGYFKVKMYGNICGIAEEIGELNVEEKENIPIEVRVKKVRLGK